jgi:hypothetical protein
LLPGNLCQEANSIDNLFGKPINSPQISGIWDNTWYDPEEDIPAGFECFDDGPELDHVIWYSFIGDGKDYRITTIACNAPNYIPGGNTQMAIYTGSCGNLVPVACNEDLNFAAGEANAQIQLLTQIGVMYFILLDGNTPGSSEGQFCLEVTRLSPSTTHNINRTKIGIVPNPTTGIIYIREAEAVRLEIFDTMGQLVFFQDKPGYSVDISVLPAGFYVIKIYEGDMVYSARIIVA